MFVALFGICFAFLSLGLPAQGQQVLEKVRRDSNAGTVRIMTSGVEGARMIDEIAFTVNEPGRMRVLPMIGDGGVQNVNDILFLRGIDMGVVHHDTLALLRKEKTYGRIEKRLRFVAKLFDEEIHLISRSGINDVSQLAGRKVNFGKVGSGTYARAARIFKAMGVEVVPVNFDPTQGLEKVATGEIAAALYVAARPSPILQQIGAGSGLRVLSIPAVGELEKAYRKSTLSNRDYPNLITSDRQVETIAVESVLVGYLWTSPNERSGKIANFVTAFFDRIGDIQKPYRSAKWQEIDVLADVPGWRRLQIAQDWVSTRYAEKRKADELLVASSTEALEEQFSNFLTTIEQSGSLQQVLQEPPSEEKMEDLFRDFLQWRSTVAQE
ncbi:TAXI family TRAP transporter solute-binding subunit [Anderseniella sp. Alg231-50]|uniref:TAXI family TRAP transporter solute-binding subunit n=1 Tax=Anderseniella sp. Alg231-50 TaxID=1922226 RepID=UPI00307C959F